MTMAELPSISLETLKRWRDDSKALMDNPGLHERTPEQRPDLPGRDWYRRNYEDLCVEIAAREKGE